MVQKRHASPFTKSKTSVLSHQLTSQMFLNISDSSLMRHNTNGVNHWQQSRAVVCLLVSGCSVIPARKRSLLIKYQHGYMLLLIPPREAQNQMQTLMRGFYFIATSLSVPSLPWARGRRLGTGEYLWAPIPAGCKTSQLKPLLAVLSHAGFWSHGERCPGDCGNVRDPGRAHRGGGQHRDADVAGDGIHRGEHHRDGDPLRGLVDELLPSGQHSDAV